MYCRITILNTPAPNRSPLFHWFFLWPIRTLIWVNRGSNRANCIGCFVVILVPGEGRLIPTHEESLETGQPKNLQEIYVSSPEGLLDLYVGWNKIMETNHRGRYTARTMLLLTSIHSLFCWITSNDPSLKGKPAVAGDANGEWFQHAATKALWALVHTFWHVIYQSQAIMLRMRYPVRPSRRIQQNFPGGWLQDHRRSGAIVWK